MLFELSLCIRAFCAVDATFWRLRRQRPFQRGGAVISMLFDAARLLFVTEVLPETAWRMCPAELK